MADTYQTSSSSDDTLISIQGEPGDPVPTFGYPTGGSDAYVVANDDGSVTLNVLIPGSVSGGELSYNGTGTYTVTSSSAPAPPAIPEGAVVIPPPPPVNSNEYDIWLATYFGTTTPDPTPVLSTVTGVVQDQNGNPVQAEITCRDRTTHAIIGEATSNAVTGAYEVTCYTNKLHYITCKYNDIEVLVKDRVTTVLNLAYQWNTVKQTFESSGYLPWPVTAYSTRFSDIYMKADGTKVWAVSLYGYDVVVYSLSTPYDLSTATAELVWDTGITDFGNGMVYAGIYWKDDGTYLYILNGNNEELVRFPVPTPWDVESIVSSDNTQRSGQVFRYDDGLRKCHWSPDGLQFTYYDFDAKSLRSMTSASAWTPTGLTDTQYNNTVASMTIYESDDIPAGGSTCSNCQLWGFAYNDDGTEIAVLAHIPKYLGMTLRVYTLTTPYDLSSKTTYYRVLLPPYWPNTYVGNIHMSPNGKYMYLFWWGLQTSENYWCRYELGTAWDFSTLDTSNLHVLTPPIENPATYSYPVGANLVSFLNSGGTMQVVDYVGDVHQYTLPTPYRVKGAVLQSSNYSSAYTPSGQMEDYMFSGDGLSFYMCDRWRDIYKRTLTTPFDFNSMNGSSTIEDVGSTLYIAGIAFSEDGNYLFILDRYSNNFRLIRITCTSPYLIEEGMYENNVVQETAFYNSVYPYVTGIWFRPGGRELYMWGDSSSGLVTATLTTAWDLSSITFSQLEYWYFESFHRYQADRVMPTADGESLLFMNSNYMEQLIVSA